MSAGRFSGPVLLGPDEGERYSSSRPTLRLPDPESGELRVYQWAILRMPGRRYEGWRLAWEVVR